MEILENFKRYIDLEFLLYVDASLNFNRMQLHGIARADTVK